MNSNCLFVTLWPQEWSWKSWPAVMKYFSTDSTECWWQQCVRSSDQHSSLCVLCAQDGHSKTKRCRWSVGCEQAGKHSRRVRCEEQRHFSPGAGRNCSELSTGGFHCTHLSGKMKTNLVSCSDLFHSHRSGPVRSGPVRSSRMLDLYWTSFLTDSGHRSVFHPRRPWLERFCTTTGRCDAPVCPPLGLQTSTWGQPPHH